MWKASCHKKQEVPQCSSLHKHLRYMMCLSMDTLHSCVLCHSKYFAWTNSKFMQSWNPQRVVSFLDDFKSQGRGISWCETWLQWIENSSGIFLSFVLQSNNQTSVDSSTFNHTLQLVRLFILCTLLSRALLTLDLLAFLSTTYTASFPWEEHITKQRNSETHT